MSGEAITCLKPAPDKPQKISGMLKNVRFVPLETTENSLIGRTIGKIKKINSRYYVASDRKELLEFDSNGSYIKTIGRVGQGPGEFVELEDYDVFDNGNTVILDYKKLILYDKEGKYLQSIPLKIVGYNIKIVADDRILVYETGFEEYAVHEINLSGEILQRALKTAKATRIGRPVKFFMYGTDKIIISTGVSNDFVLYDLKDKKFVDIRLLCDDDILTSEKEEKIRQVQKNLEGITEKMVSTLAGCQSHFFFACGTSPSKSLMQVLNISSGNVDYAMTGNDIDDVTFTSPFFLANSWACETDAGFLTYIYPDRIWSGLEKNTELKDSPNYKKLKEIFGNMSEEEVSDLNPMLIEFAF
jgi:hypothetical protein